MLAFTNKELNLLIADLQKNPEDLDLLNSIALVYFENYDLKSDREDFDYFERAFYIKRQLEQLIILRGFYILNGLK